jgi:hypothetical protein
MSINKILSCALTVSLILLFGCDKKPATVSFKSEVKPLIDKYCSECHVKGGEGVQESGFVSETYASIMKGTRYGPVVIPENAISSSLYRLVAGKVDESIRMPHEKSPLSGEEVKKIKHWIDQGAKNN